MLIKKILSYYNKTQNTLSGKTINIPERVLEKIQKNISENRNQEIAFYLQGTLLEEKNIFNVEALELPNPINILDLSRIKKKSAEIIDSEIHLYQSARSELKKNNNYIIKHLYQNLYQNNKLSKKEFQFLITYRNNISLDEIEAVSYHNGVSIKKKIQNRGNYAILCHSHTSQQITAKELAQDKQHGEGIVFYIDQQGKLQHIYYEGVKNPSPSKKRNALCNKEVAGIFDLDVTNKTPEEIDKIAKAIEFSVPVLAPHKGTNSSSKIIRFNGDLSILENLKEDGPINYKKAIFEIDSTGNYLKDKNGRLIPKEGAIIIDSNDTVRLKHKNTYYTLIKRSDYHMLQNPWPNKVKRELDRNFITAEFLDIFKKSESIEENNYLEEFNNQVLKDYITEENKYNQIITDEYSTFDEFYRVLLTIPEKLAKRGLIDLSSLKNYPIFLKNNQNKIQEFYKRSENDDESYNINNIRNKNIPLQLLADLFQKIDLPGSDGDIIVNQLQKIYTDKTQEILESSIFTKIDKFINNFNNGKDKNKQLKEEHIAKLLILTLSAHDPHTALEHSVKMANNLQVFLNFIENNKYDIEIFGRNLEKHEKEILTIGFILHDIGKLFISSILLRKKKPTRETDFQGKKEQEHIDKHSNFGTLILETLNFSKLIVYMAKHHHPKNNPIPTEELNENSIQYNLLKLCEIFDVYNALRAERGYKLEFTWDIASLKTRKFIVEGADKIKEIFEIFIKKLKI